MHVNPFSRDISHYVSVEGASMVSSTIAILRWVEVELGISYMGCILARFWITDCLKDKAIPLVIGSHQIKKIFNEANLDKIDEWPKPWKTVYEWYLVSTWHEKGCYDDLYDSDDYEEEDTRVEKTQFVRNRLESIYNMPAPKSQKEMKQFLGINRIQLQIHPMFLRFGKTLDSGHQMWCAVQLDRQFPEII